MKTFFLASLTVVSSLILALVVGELAIRVFWVPPSELSTAMSEKHPYYGLVPRPGITGRHVKMEFDYEFTNTSQGFRGDTLFSSSRPENIQNRILFLGDSFTWGSGSANDKAFVERIYSRIPHTEVINSGVNGYGQRQELARLDVLGPALKPDLVVLMFFWNDIEDNIKVSSPNFSVAIDGRVIRTDLSIPEDFDPLLSRYAAEPIDKTEEKVWRKTFLYKLFKEGARAFRHRLFGIVGGFIKNEEQRENAWKVTSELLRLIKLRSEEIGATLLVVSIPDYELVSPDGKLKGQEAVKIEIEDRIRQELDALQIEYFDLLPELKLRQEASRGPLYYLTDRHLTPDGNEVVADVLRPILIESLSRHHSSTTQP
jgi:lysophospholipase L1-like esterase